MRTQSPDVVSSLLAQDTSEAYLVLLTLEVDDNGTPKYFRFTSDSVDTVLPPGDPEDIYEAFPFTITLPNQVEDQISTCRLSVTNVDRQLVEFIRTQTVPIKAGIEVVLSSNYDVMVSYVDFSWRQLSYDAMTISGSLTLEDFLNEQAGHLMTAKDYPGLFFN